MIGRETYSALCTTAMLSLCFQYNDSVSFFLYTFTWFSVHIVSSWTFLLLLSTSAKALKCTQGLSWSLTQFQSCFGCSSQGVCWSFCWSRIWSKFSDTSQWFWCSDWTDSQQSYSTNVKNVSFQEVLRHFSWGIPGLCK